MREKEGGFVVCELSQCCCTCKPLVQLLIGWQFDGLLHLGAQRRVRFLVERKLVIVARIAFRRFVALFLGNIATVACKCSNFCPQTYSKSEMSFSIRVQKSATVFTLSVDHHLCFLRCNKMMCFFRPSSILTRGSKPVVFFFRLKTETAGIRATGEKRQLKVDS